MAVRGQYGPGFVGGPARPRAIARRRASRPSRITETYRGPAGSAIDNWRWAGVPFYLRTGKRLPKRASEIAVQFKPHAASRVPAQPGGPRGAATGSSSASSPTRASSLTFGAKLPGAELRIKPVEMDFDYGQAFGGEPPEAYERLLLDAMKGDATLYARGDWVDDGVGAARAGARRPGPAATRESSPTTRPAPGAPAEADTLIERERPALAAPLSGRRRRGAADVRLELRRRLTDHPRRRHLHPGVVPALVDQDLERAAGLLVHLRGALVGRGRRRQVLPAVGLERRAERDGEAIRLDAALVEDAGPPSPTATR